MVACVDSHVDGLSSSTTRTHANKHTHAHTPTITHSCTYPNHHAHPDSLWYNFPEALTLYAFKGLGKHKDHFKVRRFGIWGHDN